MSKNLVLVEVSQVRALCEFDYAANVYTLYLNSAALGRRLYTNILFVSVAINFLSTGLPAPVKEHDRKVFYANIAISVNVGRRV